MKRDRKSAFFMISKFLGISNNVYVLDFSAICVHIEYLTTDQSIALVKQQRR